MSAREGGAPFEPFFLSAEQGERFCVFHPPLGDVLGTVVYLHPFAEEMNKSRRMAALQSRALAARGFAVLQIDLFGCGDSSGEFGEAGWDIWKGDVALAVRWLSGRVTGPLYLWGLRLGALLALDYAKDAGQSVAGFLLWQPLASGEQFMTQFLRLRVANEMISAGTTSVSTQDLRKQLEASGTLEVAGYDLASAMVSALDRLKLINLAPRAPAYWLELVPEAGRPLPPASRRVADAWLAQEVKLTTRTVVGDAFWNCVEIVDCPGLIEETIRVLGEAHK